MLLLLLGCNPCDSAALSSAVNGDDVLAACQAPDPLVQWHSSGEQEPPDAVVWTCDSPAIDSPRIGSRRAVHAACGVGEEHDFVYSSGQPYLAVAMQQWADAEGIEGDLATPFLGEPIIPPVELPVLQIENPVEPTGEFSTVARDAMVSELNEGPLRLAVQNGDDWLHVIELEAGESDQTLWLVEEGVAYEEDGVWTFEDNADDIPPLIGPAVKGGDHMTVEAWLEIVARHKDVKLAPQDRCEEPPAGMICVPAGLVVSATGPALVPTFYMDARPVDTKEYSSCVDEGFCKRANPERFNYRRLEEYCTWSGKRVPNEWEWEAGQESGSFDAWGTEWTNTYWHDEDVEAVTWDPWGPCGGAYPCAGNTSKVLRGPERDLRRRARRADSAGTGRCVVGDPSYLATWPPQQLEGPPSADWTITELSDEDRGLVVGVDHLQVLVLHRC